MHDVDRDSSERQLRYVGGRLGSDCLQEEAKERFWCVLPYCIVSVTNEVKFDF